MIDAERVEDSFIYGDANRRAELVLIGLERYVEDTESCPKLAAP